MINSDINTRVMITMPKELKEKLEKISKEDERTLSNLIVKILKDYINSNNI